jgi:hypothetical protein
MDKPQKMPKVAKVKNKAPAEIQITAEQLLREAKERDLEICAPPPKQKIQDEAELADYQQRKRKTFEDNLRKDRSVSIFHNLTQNLPKRFQMFTFSRLSATGSNMLNGRNRKKKSSELVPSGSELSTTITETSLSG